MANTHKVQFPRVLARQKGIAVATVALVVAAAALFLTVQRPVYESTASVALLPGTQLNDTLGAYDAVVTRLLPLYASKVRSQTFLDRVAGRLHEPARRGQLRSKVFAKQDPGAAVLDLVARDQDPESAARLAKATLDQFLAEAEETPERTRIVTFEIIEAPATPTTPVFPRPALVLGAALLLAGLLAIAAAVTWDRLFGRIHELDELKRASGERVLGAVPYEPRLGRSGSSLFVGDPLLAAAEESLRGIRTVLLRPGRPMPSKITVTSLHPGDGKSTLVANLAIVAAEIGLRVLVVDADTTSPRQHEIFGLPNETGLSSVILGLDDAVSMLHSTPFPRVSVLTSGPRTQERSEAVESYLNGIPRLGSLADLVIVDSPSLLTDADVGLLAAVTDGVVFLVRAGSTMARRLRSALDGFEELEVPVLGLVLTMTSKHAASYLPYRSGSGLAAGRRPSLAARGLVASDAASARRRTSSDSPLESSGDAPWPGIAARDGEDDRPPGRAAGTDAADASWRSTATGSPSGRRDGQPKGSRNAGTT